MISAQFYIQHLALFSEIFSDGLMKMPYINADTRQVKMRDVPIDVLLSVPMFLRSYLVCRFMVLHSKQFQVR